MSASTDNTGTHAADERLRQAALDRHGIVDTPGEPAFDDIARLAALLCGAPVAMVSFLDGDRQWFKASVGLGGRQTPRSEAICDATIRDPSRVLVVGDLSRDPRFARLDLRSGGERLRFYAGAPLRDDDGFALGTVAVMDVRPRRLSPGQVDGLAALARQAAHLLQLRVALLEQARLAVERDALAKTMHDREQDLQQRHDRLAHAATHDALTGLLNRTAFEQLRHDGQARRRLDAGAYVLAVLDIDHFKQVNDRHGHLLGDRALRAVAHAIEAVVRKEDVAVRFGGEEFLLILPGTRLDAAMEVAERIRRAVEQVALPFPLSVSIGLAPGDPGADDPEAVFARADQALYRAKAAGRNRIVADDTPRVPEPDPG
ncbi:sensor domain-containing diguanylate cyclase [Luteimonas pelagia]